MQRSTERILTTHVGSLPRPPDLLDTVQQGGADEARLRDAVKDIVRKQIELGIDVIDDGEFGKPSFVSYVNDRLGGFEFEQKPREAPWSQFARGDRLSRFLLRKATWPRSSATWSAPGRSPIAGRRSSSATSTISRPRSTARSVEDVFMPAISPSNIEDWQSNAYYKTQEEYLFAIAEAMREEYTTIVDAGFILQIDDPRLVTYWMIKPDASVEDCRKWAQPRIEALNHALRGIPEEKIRHHTCYGINIGPRLHDMELKHMIDLVLKIRAGAYSFEAANPRHEHEWRVWETPSCRTARS